MTLQDCLKLTLEQREEMIRLRATSLAKQAENQAQWHQLCTAIAQVISAAHCQLYVPKHSHHCSCLLLLIRKDMSVPL
jgi:ribosomal protein L29